MSKVVLSLFLGYLISTTFATEQIPIVDGQKAKHPDVPLNLTDANFQQSSGNLDSEEPVRRDMMCCIDFPGFTVEIFIPAEASGATLAELTERIERTQQSAEKAWEEYYAEKQREREFWEFIKGSTPENSSNEADSMQWFESLEKKGQESVLNVIRKSIETVSDAQTNHDSQMGHDELFETAVDASKILIDWKTTTEPNVEDLPQQLEEVLGDESEKPADTTPE